MGRGSQINTLYGPVPAKRLAYLNPEDLPEWFSSLCRKFKEHLGDHYLTGEFDTVIHAIPKDTDLVAFKAQCTKHYLRDCFLPAGKFCSVSNVAVIVNGIKALESAVGADGTAKAQAESAIFKAAGTVRDKLGTSGFDTRQLQKEDAFVQLAIQIFDYHHTIFAPPLQEAFRAITALEEESTGIAVNQGVAIDDLWQVEAEQFLEALQELPKLQKS